MSKNSPSLIVRKLYIKGRNNNYVVNFNSGLNIIYGDSDTGKTSILNLIDYLLGGKKVDLYDELEYNAEECFLEVALNGKVFTIKRDIYNNKKYIDVYQAPFEGSNNIFPIQYKPFYDNKTDEEVGYFSDFLLESLNIPSVKIKQAPSKEVSEMHRLSFRDIFKYCYLKQDDVGSKNLLSNQYYARYSKIKTTFKFIFNVLDEQMARLEGEISEKAKRVGELTKEYNIISQFLRNVQIKNSDTLIEAVDELDQELDRVDKRIAKINTAMKADTVHLEEIRNTIYIYEKNLEKGMKEKSIIEVVLEQNLRLKKEYSKDIEKFKSSLEVISKLPINLTKEIDCPICQRAMSLHSLKESLGENDPEMIKNEIKTATRRIKEIAGIIDNDINKLNFYDEKIERWTVELNAYKLMLDVEVEEYISPFLKQREELVAKRSSLDEKRREISNMMKIRNQVSQLKSQVDVIEGQIVELKEKYAFLKDNAPSTETILEGISDILDWFIKLIPIRNPFGITLNRTNYLPIIRDREYIELTSGGLRTIVSVGYMMSILIMSITQKTNLPKILMIDTIGKYLGKTKTKDLSETNKLEDKKEGIDDPTKYVNLYKALISLDKKYHDQYQMIIIDNDIPEVLESEIEKYIVKRFSTEERPGFEKGLIFDA